MSLFTPLTLFAIATALIIGYVSGLANTRWAEYKDQKAAQNAEKEALRLRVQQAEAKQAENGPLWEAYRKRVEDERAMMEKTCTAPPFVIHMKMDQDYPGFVVKKRVLHCNDAVASLGSYYDADGRYQNFIKDPPPSVLPEFTVCYQGVSPMVFPTAPDAERWLEASLNPETVSWGYDANGKSLGALTSAVAGVLPR